jgi:hypothetical protein
MKRLIILMVITTLMLTSCFGGRDEDVHDNTLGDDNGDGMIEDGTDDGMGGENNMLSDVVDGAETLINDIGNGMDNLMNGGETEDRNDMMNNSTETGVGENEPNFTTVDKVLSADDAVNFIGANVYSLCRNVIPIMTETKILTEEEKQSVTYNTGIADTTGIYDIIVSESSLESFAYSFLMLRTDGQNTDTLQSEVGNSINPEQWLGVVAEKVASIKLDNDIVLVMGGSEQVDTIMNSVVAAADGVYDNIGQIISVLG